MTIGITNLNPIDLILPEDKEAVYKIIAEDMFENNLQQTNEFRSLTKDEREIWISAIGVKTEYQGRLAGLISIRGITELKLAEFAINERLKELNCLYGISKIIEIPDLSIEEIFRKVISLVPTSWQYPEITVCRIITDGIEYKKLTFKKTDWMQSSNIKVDGKTVGIIEICYLEKMPDIDEGPFLKEERLVIDAVAERIGYVIERKQAENMLRDAYARHSAMIENIGDVITIVGADGITKYQSPNIEKWFGWKPEDLIGTNGWDKIHPEDIERIQKGFSKILKKETASIVEYRFKCKDGNYKWIELSVVNRINEHAINGVLLNYHDITERKRTEQVQKVLYNISNAVITTVNLEYLIILIQKELEKIIDTSNFYIALYDEKIDMFSIPYLADEKEDLRSFPAGKSFTNYVLKTQKSLLANKQKVNELIKSGDIERIGTASKVWLGVPLSIAGKPIGVIAVQSYTDENAFDESDKEILEFVSHQVSISIERKKHEDELIEALKKATESDRLKSAFLTNMSHEIRTPMNGILGFSSLLKQPDLSSKKQQEYIQIIEKGGARMLNIIDNIVSISKIESGQMEVNIGELNINEQIEFLYTFFKPEVEEKGLQFSSEVSLPSKKAILKTDGQKVYTILANLLKNAIKYTKKGYIEFGYTQNKNTLVFYIKDSGIGIPFNRQEVIFERFIQADIEDKMAYQGAGLGLSISKAYVEMLGGKIWVESEEENLPASKKGGSTFYFTIPYKPLSRKEDIAKNEILHSNDVTPIDKYSILIVEDDETSAEFI